MGVKTQVAGDWEVGSFLAAGSVGNVYRARRLETGQPAVIKFLQSDSAQLPEVQRRFVREVAVAEKLNHPNIVRHYDCGLADDQIFFVMEEVDCGTLKEVLMRRGRLPWREAVEVAVQVCAALEHAHALGIIHRDLKPANLFLSTEGHVKVGDFGLARDLGSSRITQDGHTVGTARYMPPEQIYGEDELTGAVDLYALGCILFEMLAGRPAFDGNTVIDIFEAHLHQEPTPPADLVPDCPPDLSKLVLKLLAKSAADRPASAAGVQDALVDVLHGRATTPDDRATVELPTGLVMDVNPSAPPDPAAAPDESTASDLAAKTNPGMASPAALQQADSMARADRRVFIKPFWLVMAIISVTAAVGGLIWLTLRYI